MTSEWRTKDGATGQVKNLLEQAGLPLELQVAELCTKFRASHATAKEVHITSEKIVYSTSVAENNYREVDQRIKIYEEFGIGELTGIQLIVNMPIECKYRRDVECFAFPLSDETAHYGFPILSQFAGSELSRSLAASYTSLEGIGRTSTILVEVEGGKTPHKIHKENLIYNAAGSLYDFVIFDLSPEEDVEEKSPDQIDDELNLFSQFKDYLENKRFVWWSVLREWISKIESETCDVFNQKYFSGHRIYHAVSAHLPIVCINGPIYRVQWNSSSGIQSFDEIPYCLSSIRKRSWPGKARFKLAARAPEAPVIVTNPNGLNSVLEIGFSWYKEIRDSLTRINSEAERRWALESLFFDQVVRYYIKEESERGYRSDLDFGQWL
jgi:hypothetical protein